MQTIALLDGERTYIIDYVKSDGKVVCQNQQCGAEMVAKQGDIQAWHWAHKASVDHCNWSNMSEEHMSTQRDIKQFVEREYPGISVKLEYSLKGTRVDVAIFAGDVLFLCIEVVHTQSIKDLKKDARFYTKNEIPFMFVSTKIQSVAKEAELKSLNKLFEIPYKWSFKAPLRDKIARRRFFRYVASRVVASVGTGINLLPRDFKTADPVFTSASSICVRKHGGGVRVTPFTGKDMLSSCALFNTSESPGKYKMFVRDDIYMTGLYMVLVVIKGGVGSLTKIRYLKSL